MAPHGRKSGGGGGRPTYRAHALGCGAAFVLALCTPAGAQELPGDTFILRGTDDAVTEIPWFEREAAPAPVPLATEAAAERRDTSGRAANRRNLRVQPVDARSPAARRAPETSEQNGIRAGTFIIRPSISQGIATERTESGGDRDSRVFSRTEGAVEVISDWSRHQLRLEGSAAHEENLSGEGQTEPSADLAGELRLDLADETVATLRAGYSFSREDESDPNALVGAVEQADVHEFSVGAGIERSAGLLRASFDVDAAREIYGDARLADGTVLNLDDRDQTTVGARSRLTYDRSAVFAPFAEVETERTEFDEAVDFAGYDRSAWTYALRAGVELDMGEKWFGEIAAGYALRDIDDPRLDEIGALTLDGQLNWSPRRGTDVALGFVTDIESSTTPGLPGSVAYIGYATLTQAVRHDIAARLGGGLTLREFEGLGIEDQYVWNATAGLTWSLNRYLDLIAEAGYERTEQDGAETYDTATFGLGMTIRR